MPRLLCICGPNGAGKSTFTRTVALRENLLVIDPDKLAADGLSSTTRLRTTGANRITKS